jgi:hypothetical protein
MSVPSFESLESRTLLSASPDVIAADRAALLANQAAVTQYIKEKTATLSADRRTLVLSLLGKAREAGLLRANLIRTAIAQWKIIAQHQRENHVAIRALDLEIQQDRREILAASGDAAQQGVYQDELETHLAARAAAVEAGRVTLRSDLENVRAAFRGVEPQVKSFLQNAQPENDALRQQLAAKNSYYDQLIQEYRRKVLESQAKLQADLKA